MIIRHEKSNFFQHGQIRTISLALMCFVCMETLPTNIIVPATPKLSPQISTPTMHVLEWNKLRFSPAMWNVIIFPYNHTHAIATAVCVMLIQVQKYARFSTFTASTNCPLIGSNLHSVSSCIHQKSNQLHFHFTHKIPIQTPYPFAFNILYLSNIHHKSYVNRFVPCPPHSRSADYS